MAMLAPRPLEDFSHRKCEILDATPETIVPILGLILAAIDPSTVRDLQDKWAGDVRANPMAGFTKYLDIPFWLRDKLIRAHQLGLLDAQGLHVLDLGCGAGHFLAACNVNGHVSIGLDAPMEICADLAQLLGVDRRDYSIRPQNDLPPLGYKFDFVTAFAIKFDALGRDENSDFRYWALEDWDYLLRDLCLNHLAEGGRCIFQLNKRIRGDGVSPAEDVIEFFSKLGAQVESKNSTVQITQSDLNRRYRQSSALAK